MASSHLALFGFYLERTAYLLADECSEGLTSH